MNIEEQVLYISLIFQLQILFVYSIFIRDIANVIKWIKVM